MCASDTPALDAWNAKISASEKIAREIERRRSRARHNEASALGHARREGLREGEQKQSQEIAKRALNEGMPIEVISKITGLTTSKIQKL